MPNRDIYPIKQPLSQAIKDKPLPVEKPAGKPVRGENAKRLENKLPPG